MTDVYPNILNSVGCIVDLSYQERDGTITTVKGSKDEQPIVSIRKELVISTLDGKKFGEPDTIGSFKYTTHNLNGWGGETVTINYTNFSTPIGGIAFNNLNYNTGDFQLSGVDLDKTLIYEFNTGSDYFLACLVGGFTPDKLIVRIYKENEDSDDVLFNDLGWELSHYFYSGYDDDGNPTGEISLITDIDVHAIDGTPPIEDITDNIFTTYYIDTDIINEIRKIGVVPNDIIINTYSFPLNIDDTLLVDTKIKTGFITTPIDAKTFSKNITDINIFEFDVPDVPDVTEIQVRIPFNNNISLNYEDIRGKTIVGYLSYELITNTTTLYITNGDYIIFKNIFSLGIKIPYKPVGDFASYSEPNTRLGIEEPTLLIKGKHEVEKGNYLKGIIKEPIKDIVKDELDILNNLLKQGVYVNG